MRNFLPKSLSSVRLVMAFAMLTMIGSTLFGQAIEPIYQTNPNNQFVEAAPNLIPSVGINPSPEALWDVQSQFSSTAASSGDLGMAACLYFGGEFWVSRWQSDTLYRFTAAGALISEFTIPGLTGTRALTTDGTLIYAGSATATIFRINPATQTLVTPNINTSVTTVSATSPMIRA